MNGGLSGMVLDGMVVGVLAFLLVGYLAYRTHAGDAAPRMGENLRGDFHLKVEHPQIVSALRVGDRTVVGMLPTVEVTGIQRSNLHCSNSMLLDVAVRAEEQNGLRQYHGMPLDIGEELQLELPGGVARGIIVATHKQE